MGVITYNGVSSDELGLVVEHYPNFKSPNRDIEYVHIPGRNGDLLYDHGSYQNVRREYEIAFVSDFKKPNREEWYKRVRLISQWLRSADGYAKLTDDYEPGYYSLASYEDGLDIENILMQAGRVKISFNCKPQRYLDDGNNMTKIQIPIMRNVHKNFKNPSIYTAYPKIIVELQTDHNWEMVEHPGNGALVPSIEVIASKGIMDENPDNNIPIRHPDYENRILSILHINGWTKEIIPGLRRGDRIIRRIVIDSENKSIYMDPNFYGSIIDIHVNPLKFANIQAGKGYDLFPYFLDGDGTLSFYVNAASASGTNAEAIPILEASAEIQPRWWLL